MYCDENHTKLVDLAKFHLNKWLLFHLFTNTNNCHTNTQCNRIFVQKPFPNVLYSFIKCTNFILKQTKKRTQINKRKRKRCFEKKRKNERNGKECCNTYMMNINSRQTEIHKCKENKIQSKN